MPKSIRPPKRWTEDPALIVQSPDCAPYGVPDRDVWKRSARPLRGSRRSVPGSVRASGLRLVRQMVRGSNAETEWNL
jgi:hypothetical protein